MQPTNSHARGQALPLALVGIFIAAVFFAFFARSTGRLLERERVRARADATAFSAGVSYARGLNVLAASQKAVALGWVLQVFDAGKTRKAVQSLQKNFLLYGPWLSEAVALGAGADNGLLVVPVWNQEVLFEDLSLEDLKPSYNVAPYTISNALASALTKALSFFRDRLGVDRAIERQARLEIEALAKKHGPQAKQEAAKLLKRLPNGVADDLITVSHYEYTGADGKKVRVEKEDAGQVWENGPGGKKVPRHKAGKKHKYRYVAEVPTVDMELQLSLEDGDPHMITLFARQLNGSVMAISQVQVAGGSQSLGDPDGSAYGPTMVPVSLFAPGQAELATEALSLVRRLPLSAEWDRLAAKGLSAVRVLSEIQH